MEGFENLDVAREAKSMAEYIGYDISKQFMNYGVVVHDIEVIPKFAFFINVYNAQHFVKQFSEKCKKLFDSIPEEMRTEMWVMKKFHKLFDTVFGHIAKMSEQYQIIETDSTLTESNKMLEREGVDDVKIVLGRGDILDKYFLHYKDVKSDMHYHYRRIGFYSSTDAALAAISGAKPEVIDFESMGELKFD